MHALLKPTHQRCTEQDTSPTFSELYCDSPRLTAQQIQHIQQSHNNYFDWKLGGPKTAIKFLDRDSVEYALLKASHGDRLQMAMATLTLDNSLSLVDPVWGGVYQYSTRDWSTPHHSKTMNNQAGYLRIYAMAYALTRNYQYLHAAFNIRDYLKNFLLSECGGFYSGQSNFVDGIRPLDFFGLNDQSRRQYGIPTIWKSRFARENGWAIEALAYLYEISNDETSLTLAIDAARWVVKHRCFVDGGFRHDRQNQQGPYLADTLAMARAMLQLYKVTKQEQWLHHACNAADFIIMYFKQAGGGFKSFCDVETNHDCIQIDENISLMRFANLLTYYSEMKRHRGIAKHCLRYLAKKSVTTARDDEVGILLAYDEYHSKPCQIIIYTEPNTPQLDEFYSIARQHPTYYKTIHIVSLHEYSGSKENKCYCCVYQEDFASENIMNPHELQSVLEKLA